MINSNSTLSPASAAMPLNASTVDEKKQAELYAQATAQYQQETQRIARLTSSIPPKFPAPVKPLTEVERVAFQNAGVRFSAPNVRLPTVPPRVNSLKNDHSLVEMAPSGVSAWSGPTVEIISARQDSIRVRMRVPFGTIGVQGNSFPTTKGGSPMGLIMVGRDTYGSSGSLIPVETVALGPALLPSLYSNTTGGGTYNTKISNPDCSLPGIICAAFSKYRVASDLQLHYMPQTTTIDPAAFALVFTSDPMHPQVGFGAYTVGTGSLSPNFSTAKNSTNSIVFASWSTWSKTFPTDKSTEYFTTTPLSATSTTVMSTIPPFFDDNLRWSHFGAITCYANMKAETGEETPIPKGELYYEIEYEFFEFVPVTVAASLPFSYTEWMILALRAVKDDEAKKAYRRSLPPDDPESKDPPVDEDLDGVLVHSSSQPPSAYKSTDIVTSFRKMNVNSVSSYMVPPGTTIKARRNAISGQKLQARSGKVLSPQHLIKITNHLHKNIANIPKNVRGRVLHAVKLTNKKPSGWKGAVKSIVKELAGEVPVVGKLLAGLTDTVGDPILDFISGLFG